MLGFQLVFDPEEFSALELVYQGHLCRPNCEQNVYIFLKIKFVQVFMF